MSYGRDRGYGGGRFGGQRSFGGPKPVELGKEYDVEISEISRQGDGIARVQGFVIFVKGGRVGQKSKVRITNIGARFATAEIVQAASSGQPAQSEAPAQEKEDQMSDPPQQSDDKQDAAGM